MNKSFLVVLAFGAVLSACSSHPSDHRPSAKVSLDNVAPGTRDTDIYNLDGEHPDVTEVTETTHGKAEHGKHGEHEGATQMHDRKDVMTNHDEHKSDVGGEEAVPAENKTTDADKVENH